MNLRLSLRSLLRSPGFTVAAVLTLALGIGLSAAAFAVADALLLRRLPVLNEERLVTLWAAKRDGSFDHFPLTIKDAQEYSRNTRTLNDAAYVDFYSPYATPIIDNGNVTRLKGAFVSGNFFEVLGTQAILGRPLRLSDDVSGAAPVVALSYAAWQGTFHGDSLIVGRHITQQGNGLEATVVGVMPARFEYPPGTEFWAPFTPTRLRNAKDSDFAVVDLVGRLAPGASAASAMSELTAFFARPSASALEHDLRGVVQLFDQVVLGNTRLAVLVFVAAAALLLMIACLDVANLLLVRGLARVREMAIRTALGAARSRLIGQLLIENSLLALGGGAVGVVVADLALQVLLAYAPAGVPLLQTVRLNGTALAGAVGITCAATLLCGVSPAVLTPRTDLQDALRSGSRHTSTRGSRLTREWLVGAQVALAVVVLSVATLLGRSFLKLQAVDLGFDPSHVVVGEVGIRYDEYTDAAAQAALIRRIVEHLEATPGIAAVSPVVAVPFSGTAGWDGRAALEGQSPTEAAKNPMFNMEVVTPEYFSTFGLHVVRGRALTEADREGTEPVIVVSQSMARQYWGNQDVVGKRVVMGPAGTVTVVGVVPDTRYRDLRTPRATVYFPLAQSAFPFTPTSLAIRTSGAPTASLTTLLRTAITGTAPGVVLVSASPFSRFMDGPLSQPRLNAFLLSGFGLSAVVLAAMGLFSVMATLVKQRSRELGIRMVLGATAQGIRQLVVRRGLAIVGSGTSAGVLLALVVDRALPSLLYDVEPTDTISLIIVGVLMLAVTLIATFPPLRATGRIDPATVLRAEE